MAIDWTAELLDQLEFQWTTALRPRLDGLTDEAYLWEPVDGMWSIRRRADARSAHAAGAADVVIDFEHPPPRSGPMTTIAWRLGHIAMIFGERASNQFGDGSVSYASTDWPLTASGMRQLLDGHHDRWVAGVGALDADGLAEPCGPTEGPHADAAKAVLVLHVNREVLHHGAEVALMMDLFEHRGSLRS